MAQLTEVTTNTFRILADPIRRYVLCYLDEQETPVPFDRFATRVTAWHIDSDLDAVDDAALTEMRMALHHVHLPKLAEAGYLEYDRDTHTIRRGPNFGEITPLLRLMADHEDELPTGWL
jgi:DNA-binding transcriptional ArsR family regulator